MGLALSLSLSAAANDVSITDTSAPEKAGKDAVAIQETKQEKAVVQIENGLTVSKEFYDKLQRLSPKHRRRVLSEFRKKLKEEEKRIISMKRLAERERKKAERKAKQDAKNKERALKKAQRDKDRALKKAQKDEEKAAKAEAKKAKKLSKAKLRVAKSSSERKIKQDLETIKLKHSDKKIDKFEAKRQEIQENQQQALDFIFPSLELEEDALQTGEEFFSQTEKEQLLELWRATIARNRTIQFIIKALSPSNDELKKNNVVVQSLSKAIFVPFYAMAAVTDNNLITGGTQVGARVIGDVVDDFNAGRSRTREITQTEMVVMFLLVDEVAERLREAYSEYKLVRIERDLLDLELKEAQFDAAEALEIEDNGSELARYFTRKVVRNIQQQLRRLSHLSRRKRSTLVELAGTEAVASVDILIDLESETLINDVSNI